MKQKFADLPTWTFEVDQMHEEIFYVPFSALISNYTKNVGDFKSYDFLLKKYNVNNNLKGLLANKIIHTSGEGLALYLL